MVIGKAKLLKLCTVEDFISGLANNLLLSEALVPVKTPDLTK